MEKKSQRGLYWNNFYEFCDKVELKPQLIAALKRHPYFRKDMTTVLKFSDIEKQKICILLEFTRMRSTCEEMVKILENTGQTEAAKVLKAYNTSPGRNPFSNEVEIKVTQAKAEMKGSLCYNMTKKPRGMCIIINNVTKRVHMESKRFDSIFTQLYFNVSVYKNGMTVKEIRETLLDLSQSKSLSNNEAFILMIISHGKEEKILDINGCKKVEYGIQVDKEDMIEIKEIVDIFSEKNCKHLQRVPKLFFFTCCRDKIELPEDSILELEDMEYEPIATPDSIKERLILGSNEVQVLSATLGNPLPKHASGNQNRSENSNNNNSNFGDWKPKELQTISKQWAKENRDTFICYSCPEGFKTFFDPVIGITYFGQALSHSIAQYACEENLHSILSRTCGFIDDLEIYSFPEMSGQGLRRQLYFNPGFNKSSDSNEVVMNDVP